MVEFFDKNQQGLKRLLNRHSILLAVILSNDLFVMPLKIRAQRVLFEKLL